MTPSMHPSIHASIHPCIHPSMHPCMHPCIPWDGPSAHGIAHGEAHQPRPLFPGVGPNPGTQYPIVTMGSQTGVNVIWAHIALPIWGPNTPSGDPLLRGYMAKVHPINMGAYRRFSPYIWALYWAHLGLWEPLFGPHMGPNMARKHWAPRRASM